MPDKLLSLKNDLVFQELFGKQKNCEITRHLLSLILEKEIYNIDLDVNKRMLKDRADAKIGRLDIRAKFNDGEDCNIELQVLPYNYMPERMLNYWASMYGNKINRGQEYNVLKPSISILIADYELKQIKEIPKYHTVWNLREKDYHNCIITNNIELHILEIPKIKDVEILKDELAQWLKFIENPENKEVEKFMCENKFYKQAREELAYLSEEPDFQMILQERAADLMFLEIEKKESKEEGMAEGKREKQLEIAKKLKAKNMPIEEIMELTELTREEIEKL